MHAKVVLCATFLFSAACCTNDEWKKGIIDEIKALKSKMEIILEENDDIKEQFENMDREIVHMQGKNEVCITKGCFKYTSL